MSHVFAWPFCCSIFDNCFGSAFWSILIPIWPSRARQLGAQIHQESIQEALQDVLKIKLYFRSIFYRFVMHFGSAFDFKVDPKSIKNH